MTGKNPKPLPMKNAKISYLKNLIPQSLIKYGFVISLTYGRQEGFITYETGQFEVSYEKIPIK